MFNFRTKLDLLKFNAVKQVCHLLGAGGNVSRVSIQASSEVNGALHSELMTINVQSIT